MTINKSQSQSLKKIEIYLEDEVFTHGQYMLPIKSYNTEGLHILIHNKNNKYPNHIKNIIYKEILHKII